MVGILAQSSSTQTNPLGILPLLLLMFLGFYFLLIRPQRRRAQGQQQLLSSLEVGDEVMTGGGMFGTITEIDEDEGTVEVEIAPGTRVRMIKGGISRKLVEDYGGDDDDDDADEDEKSHEGPWFKGEKGHEGHEGHDHDGHEGGEEAGTSS